MNRQTLKPRRPSFLGAPRLLWVAGLVAVGSAHAETNPYYLQVGQILAYDSNLFRVDSGEESAWISTTGLRAGFDQPIGRQRVFGSAGVGYTVYNNFSDLNSTIYDVDLGLDWEAASKLSGSAVTRATQRQASFADYGSLAADNSGSNLERTQGIDLRAQYGGASIWTLEALGGYSKVSYSANDFADRENSYYMWGGGVRYRPGGPWSFGLTARRTDGEYPNYATGPNGNIADEYHRNDFDLSTFYQPTGASRLAARLTYSDEKHDEDASRDFNGWTGEVRWDYQATGKLRLGTNFTRVTGSGSSYSVSPPTGGGTPGVPVQSTLSQSRLSNNLGLLATWTATGKITAGATANLTREKNDNQFTGNSDWVNSYGYGLNATYAATRVWTFLCGLGYQKQDADDNGSQGYTATTATCTARLQIR